MDSRKKTVLVTGGCKGIGRAVVEEFLWLKAMVVVIDIAGFPVEFAGNPSFVYQNINISDASAVKKFCESFPVDVLVNNAAITGGNDWERIMAVNLHGTRNVTEAVLPQMKLRKQGNIIFITSVHSRVAFVGDGAYDVSKGALVSYMRSLAVELAPLGIRSNAVAPGGIAHAGRPGDMSEAEIKELGKRIPLGRFGEPREIAKAVAFLASDDASYITGVELAVDGGLLAHNAFDHRIF